MRLARRLTFWVNGGLGNQLFQYAAGRALALHMGAELYLDVSQYRYSQNRPFLLGAFNVTCLIDWLQTGGPGAGTVVERQGALNEELHAAQPGTYFKGYWQNEAYFEAIAPTLRRELQFVTPPTPANARMLERIAQTNAVAVHVRRGDYVRDSHEAAIFASCSPRYYADAAAKLIGSGVRSPTFFIFSDEPDWARAHLQLPGRSVLVDLNCDATSYEDLRLMAACRHHIVANSTFSWWGAWLNPRPDKIVIAPRTWYLSKMSNACINARNFTVIDNI
jgi:hypothetical protein